MLLRACLFAQVTQGKNKSTGRIHRIRLECCTTPNESIDKTPSWKVSRGSNISSTCHPCFRDSRAPFTQKMVKCFNSYDERCVCVHCSARVGLFADLVSIHFWLGAYVWLPFMSTAKNLQNVGVNPFGNCALSSMGFRGQVHSRVGRIRAISLQYECFRTPSYSESSSHETPISSLASSCSGVKVRFLADLYDTIVPQVWPLFQHSR